MIPPLLWVFIAVCALPVAIYGMRSTGLIKPETASVLLGGMLLLTSGAFVMILAIHTWQTGETPKPSKQGGMLDFEDHWFWHSIAWVIWLGIAIMCARAGWSILRGQWKKNSEGCISP